MGIFHRAHHSVALPLAAVLLTFVLVFIPLDAAPTLQDKCSISCRAGQASVLHYDSGEYVYDFESEITTQVVLPQPESRVTKVKAKVALVANSNCDFLIKVKALSVSDTRGNNVAAIPDVGETTGRFTLQDGIIGSVCVAKEELTYTANIKRAVISLLQNKALNGVSDNEVVESDISGRCPTKYVLSGDHYVKTKKLNACLHREGGFSVLHGVPYEVHSARNSVPDLESEQTCEQTLENGIYKKVQCTENHVVKPISADTELIHTTIKTTLTLEKTKKGTTRAAPRNLVKTSVFFDYADESNNKRNEVAAQNAREILEHICENIQPDGVSTEVPVLVLDLKKVLAHVEKEPLTQLYNEVKSGSLCSAQTDKLKKLLLDAAAISASDGAIGLLSDLYQKDELDKVTKRYFYLYTTYAARPHEEALEAVLPLLSGSGKTLSKRTLLAVSGLAHQFCKVTHPDCLEFSEYTSVVDRLAQIVQDNIRDQTQVANVIAALQALGNLDALTERAVAAISTALTSANDRVRVRALDAFRRDPCQQALKTKSQEIFANKNNPSNVRISAYLANLRCLKPEDTPVIQRVLDDEQSFQVGGFVQSNLETLVKSASPSTRQLQTAARQLHLQLKYPKELRRFSRHLGSSLFNADLNLGYNAEGNVIFSKDSFIPRQLSANLTVDLFGQSYNFLELGAYLENFDQIQESLIGPNGKYPIGKDYHPRNILNAILKRVNGGRQKREIPGPVNLDRDGLNALNKQVQVSDNHDEPAVFDVYVRVFGTTVGVLSVNAQQTEQAAEGLRSQVGEIFTLLRSDDKEIDFMHPILFLDDEFIIPTSSGLGLSTTVEGSTIPSFEYGKHLQLRTDVLPFDLKVKLASNSATSIKLRHSVLGGPIETGLQFEAGVRVGGAVELELHLQEGKKFEAKVILPNDKFRAIDVSTNVFWIEKAPGQTEHKNDFKPSLHVVAEENCNNPLNILLKRVGLKACISSNVELKQGVPAIFNGKQYFTATLEKTETSMQGYSVHLSKEGNELAAGLGANKIRNYKMILDTPGSTTNRKIVLTAQGEKDEHGTRKIEAELATPFKGVSAKLEYERTIAENQKGITAKLTTPKVTLGVQGEIKKTVTGKDTTYKPLLRLEYPGSKVGTSKKATLLTGKVVYAPGKAVSFDLASQLPDKLPSIVPLDVFARGTIKVKRQSETDYEYELKNIQAGTRSRDQDGEDTPVVKIDGSYKRHGKEQNTDLTVKSGLTLEHTFTYHKDLVREPGHFKLDTKVTSTRLFFLNFEVEADVTRVAEQGKYNSLYKLTFGPESKPRWSLSSQSNVAIESKSNFDLQNKLKFYFPVRNNPEETYDASIESHVKHVAGQEQLVDFKLLSGEDGAKGKVTLHFERKAANNNDFKLTVLVNTKKVNGELVQTRETVDTVTGYTSSYKYETELTSSTLGLEKEHLVAFVRLLNKPGKKGVSISAENTVVSSKTNVPKLNLDLSLKLTEDKYLGHLEFKSADNQVALLDATFLKTLSTSEPQLLVKSFLVGLWRIDLTRRTPAEGHGITKLHAEILKTGRTISLEVERKKEGDLRKLDADLKWDAKADASKSIQVHSVTKITRGSIIIDSKNEITVVGQKVQLDVDATIPTDIRHGEHKLHITFVGTDNQQHEIAYKNNVGIDPALRSSKAEISVKTPKLPATEVHWDVKSVNPNLAEIVFDITADVEVFTNNAKSHTLDAHLESKKESGRRSITGKLAVAGSAVPDPVSLESNLVVGEKYLSTKTKLHIGASQSGVELEAVLEDTPENIRQANVHYVLTNFPGLKYAKVEGQANHHRRLDGTLDISREHEVKLDGVTALKYTYALSLVNNKLEAAAKVDVKGTQLLDASIQGTVNAQEVDINGEVHVKEVNVKVNTHVNRVNPLQKFTLGVESGEFGINVKLESPRQSVYTLHKSLKVKGNNVELDTEVTLLPNEKGFAVKYSLTPGGLSGEVKLHVITVGENRNFEGTLTKGDKTVNFNGNVSKIAGGYEGQVNVNSPSGLNKVGKVVLSIDDSHRKLSLIAGEASGPNDLLPVDYTKQEAGAKTSLEGSFSTDLPSMLSTDLTGTVKGTFKTELSRLQATTDGETGYDVKLTTHFNAPYATPVDVNFETELKGTTLEVLTQATLKRSGQPQVSGVFQLKRPAQNAAPNKDCKFQLLFRNDAEAYGLVSTSTHNADGFDHNTKLILGNEATDVLGVHVHSTHHEGEERCEGAVDITLPLRQVTVSYVKSSARAGELSVWLDKVRKPEQKLQVAVEYEPLTTADGATGYKYQATIQHPTLAKPLVIKRQVVRFGSLIVHESTTELDVLEDSNNKFVIAAKVAYTDAAHKHLNADLSIKSQGLGLSVEGKGEVTKQDDSIIAHFQYSFTKPDGQLKSRNIEVVVSKGHQSLLVGDKASPVLLVSRTVQEQHRRRRSASDSSTIDVRYEIHLPGMSDTRVIDVHLHPSSPPHLDVKTFTTVNPTGKSYEVSVGFPNERQFVLGAYRQLGADKVSLAELSVTLNTTQLLAVKAKWDLEALQQTLKTANERFTNTNEHLEEVTEAYVQEVSQELQQYLQRLSAALPNLTPLQQRVSSELNEIKGEWGQDRPSQTLTQTVQVLVHAVEGLVEPLKKALELVQQLPEYLKNLKENSPALAQRYEKIAKGVKKAIGTVIMITLKTVRPILAQVQVLVDKVKAKLGELNVENIDDANNVIRTKARTVMSGLIARLVDAFLARADEIGNFIESSPFNAEVKELATTVLNHIVHKLKGEPSDAADVVAKVKTSIKKLVGEVLTVDIEHGVISALIPLPKPVNSLVDIGNAVVRAFPSTKLRIPYRNQLAGVAQILKQFFRDLVQSNFLTAISRALRSNIPPSSADAYIIGSQYFITFDGKFYHFEGHCQYLLVSDFLNKNITVAIEFHNVNGEIKKSIILADADETAVINSDYTVIHQTGDHIHVETTGNIVKLTLAEHELTVTCNKLFDVCTVTLDNGYHFGRVAGLLGTYNNEQYDDLRTPSGQAAETIEAFAASWKLNQQCTEAAIPQHPALLPAAQRACASAFNSRWSSLSTCYKTSDPSEYEYICNRLAIENGWTVNEAVCTAANAYEQTCHGVSLKHLSTCSE